MTCHNCAAPNPPGVTHCQRCRMPGDFGRAPAPEARVVPAALVECRNCGGHAPAQAERCPRCRWPVAPPATTPAGHADRTAYDDHPARSYRLALQRTA